MKLKKTSLLWLILNFAAPLAFGNNVTIENHTPYQFSVTTSSGNAFNYCKHTLEIDAAFPEAKLKSGRPARIPFGLPVNGRATPFPIAFLDPSYVSISKNNGPGKSIVFSFLALDIPSSILSSPSYYGGGGNPFGGVPLASQPPQQRYSQFSFRADCKSMGGKIRSSSLRGVQTLYCSVPWPSHIRLIGQSQIVRFSPCMNSGVNNDLNTLKIIDQTGVNPSATTLALSPNHNTFPEGLSKLVILKADPQHLPTFNALGEVQENSHWTEYHTDQTHSANMLSKHFAFYCQAKKNGALEYLGTPRDKMFGDMQPKTACLEAWDPNLATVDGRSWGDWLSPSIAGAIVGRVLDFFSTLLEG